MRVQGRKGTFSIAAVDAGTGEIGCAVQSRYFAVGNDVPWGRAAGGDVRGQQSSAVVVERPGAAGESREGLDRVCDLRVDDHPEPIEELRRLLGIHLVWDALRSATAHYAPGRYADGVALLAAAHERFGDDPVLLYDLACFECLDGRTGDALDHVKRAIELDPGVRAAIAVDSDFAALAASPEFQTLVSF